MQSYPRLLGAAGAAVVLIAACGGKVVVESTGATSGDSTTGGNGGAGGVSSASAPDGPFSAVAVGVTSAGQVGSTGITTGSGMSCLPCAKAAMDPAVNTGDICPDAVPLYKDLFGCMCAGACATQCSANICIGQAMSGQCSACVANVGDGCGFQLDNCLSDM